MIIIKTVGDWVEVGNLERENKRVENYGRVVSLYAILKRHSLYFAFLSFAIIYSHFILVHKVS